MDWFLYGNCFRHERIKGPCDFKGGSFFTVLTSLVTIGRNLMPLIFQVTSHKNFKWPCDYCGWSLIVYHHAA